MHKGRKALLRVFCTEVRAWRKGLGLSQSELARLVGLSPSWISMVERGDIIPTFPKRQRLRLILEDLEFKRIARRLHGIRTPPDCEEPSTLLG